MKTIFILSLMLSTQVSAKMNHKEIKYEVEGVEMVGELVDASEITAAARVPGVIIVSDWMGITDRTRAKAEEIAKLGYVAFAADIYGKGIRPQNSQEAGQLAMPLKSNRPLYRKRVLAAFEAFKNQRRVNEKKIAVMGFCIGGTGALELARSGADIKGAVSFHGLPDSPTPADAKNIKGKILVLHGADDPLVSAQNLVDFESEMKEAKVDWELVKYGGAVHSFTDRSAGSDNSKGAAYNEKADRRSWKALQNFLTEIF